jgi:hypothetical protein
MAIDELESTIPSWVERLMPLNYPAYVHVLRVSGILLHQFSFLFKVNCTWSKEQQA